MLAQKRILFNFHLCIDLNKTDILSIVNYAFRKSFQVVETNIIVNDTRRWIPLKHTLLNHIKLESYTLISRYAQDQLNHQPRLNPNFSEWT